MAADPPPTAVYSVWALPPPSITARIETLISTLRTHFPSPAFPPHITLVGAIRLPAASALALLHSAAASLIPFPATVSKVSTSSFQCVFLLIHPSRDVLCAGAHCSHHFGYKSDFPYMPHLSLLYADMEEEEKERARRMAEEIDREIRGVSFEVEEIALYKTDPEDKSLESWERIAVCNLRKS